MSGEELLKQIDPGTGLALEDLIDAFISDQREANRIKARIARRQDEKEPDECTKT